MMKSGKRVLWVAAALLAAAGGVSAQSFNAAPRLTCGSSTTMATTQVNLNTGYLPDRSAELAVGNSDNLWQVNENGWGLGWGWGPAYARGLPQLNPPPAPPPWVALPTSGWIGGRTFTGPSNSNIEFAAGFSADSTIDLSSVRVTYTALVDDALDFISFNGGTPYSAANLNVTPPLASGFSSPVSQDFLVSAIAPPAPTLNVGSNYISFHVRNAGWNYGLNMALQISANCVNYQPPAPVPANSWWALTGLGAAIGLLAAWRGRRRHVS